MSHFGFITAIFMGDDALMHATAGLLGLQFCWLEVCYERKTRVAAVRVVGRRF